MLYIKAFNDYDGFRRIFGITTHGNGEKSRNNKILLNHLKQSALLKWCRERNDYELLSIDNMADLKKQVTQALIDSGKQDPALTEKVTLIGKTFFSSKYRTDHLLGVCEDFDKKAIRYINVERERAFKMKAGKFYSSIIKECELGKTLNPSVVTWLAEEFAADWETFTYGTSPEVELVVDDDFEAIYSEENCKDFHGCSCMVGRDRHSFYEDSVKAKAASIIDVDGYVLARAIIFTDVTDQNGKKWRLLERQYSRESSDVLKRILIDLLIKGNHIDGYKQVGAGCGDSRSFVDNEGNSLADYEFSTDMELETDSCLSYQDSFKWFNMEYQKAYNYECPDARYRLDTTDYNLYGDMDDDEDDDEYDEYHDRNCQETTLCYLHGIEIYVDSDDLEDFYFVESLQEYHHEDDVTRCENCDEYVLDDKALHSDITDEYYCCEECMQEAETEFKKKNWFFCEFDNEWFEDSDKVMIINIWNPDEKRYQEKTIYEDTLDRLLENREVFYFDNTYFDKVDLNTNLPYGYYLERKKYYEYEAA